MREIALKILYDINEKGAYSNIAINRHLENSSSIELKKIDKSFITGLTYGTIKWRLTIDYIIEQFSNIPMKKLSPWILNTLRLGVYQIMYADKIPVSAACNESVKLARKYGHKASSGFVNGLLRNLARNKDKIVYPDKNENLVKYLSVEYSFPEWMVKRWIDIYGEDFTEKLLQGSNETPEFSISVNNLKIPMLEFMQKLSDEGIEWCESQFIDNALILKDASGITRSDLYEKGYFQVQDQASMLVSRILDPKPNELVMDICAAPGGKTANIAQLMNNEGTVISRDIYPHKIKLIEDMIIRLGYQIIKTQLFDATNIDSCYISKADRVLVDAPCTGLGIIRRKPDIKWTRNLSDLQTITSLQLKILSASSNYVRKGGFLVYSTCTIEPMENIEVVNKFLSLNNNFKLEGFERLLPEKLNENKTANEGYIQLFPGIYGLDGFFIAKLRRYD